MEQTPDQKADKIVEKYIVTFALALAFLARFAFQQTSNSVGHCHLPPILTVSWRTCRSSILFFFHLSVSQRFFCASCSFATLRTWHSSTSSLSRGSVLFAPLNRTTLPAIQGSPVTKIWTCTPTHTQGILSWTIRSPQFALVLNFGRTPSMHQLPMTLPWICNKEICSCLSTCLQVHVPTFRIRSFELGCQAPLILESKKVWLQVARSLFEFVERAMQGYGISLLCGPVCWWDLDALLFMSSCGKHQAKDRNPGMERAPAKERSREKRKARHNHKRRRARSKERSLERASMRRVDLPTRRERTKATARKVSKVENRAKIEKVHVETVPVIQTREIHTLFRVPCGCSWNVLFVQMSPTASRWRGSLFWAYHVEVGVQAEYMSSSVCTVALRLVGSSARCQTPFQRQRTTRSEPFYLSQSRHWEWVEMEGNSWPEWVRKAGVREHDEQAYCAWQHIARSGCGTSHSIFPRSKKCGVKKRSRKRESKDWSTQEDPSAKTYLNSHGWHSNRLKTLDWQRSPSEKDSDFALMKLSDVSALHEDTLAGKGYNEFTLHDMNSLSMKSLWKWTKTVSVDEGIQELMKELLLDSSRFDMEGVIAQLQTNWRHTNLLDRSNPEQSTQRQRIRWSLLEGRWLENWESTLPWKVHLEFSCRVPRENWTFGAWPGRQTHHCWLQRLLCGRWSLVPCENGCSNLGVEGQEFNREGPFLFTPKSIRD